MKIPCIINVTHQRVSHYNDVIEQMLNTEIEKCRREGWVPTQQEIEFYKKECIRYAVIRSDLETALKLRIKKREIL